MSFNSIKFLYELVSERRLTIAHTEIARLVRCKFRIFFAQLYFSKREPVPAGNQILPTAARFRRIFISRGVRKIRTGETPFVFRSDGRTLEKRKFFRSKGNRVYGALRVGLISRVAETIPKKRRRYSLTSSPTTRTYCEMRRALVANLVLSHFCCFFFFFLFLLSRPFTLFLPASL